MMAFFGMGLLGSNFVRALRQRGENVHVWNRTAAKARALESEGATVFEDPAEAARGAVQIHLTLSEDGAVDDVLERARAGFSPGVTIVDHSTTSPDSTRARAARWKERGVEFLHAPVFMGPQNALESTGIMLVSGDSARAERLRPTLETMTGKLVNLGEDPARAAMFKLFGNLFLMFMTAGVAEVLTLAKGFDVMPEEATALFEFFNPASSIGLRAKKMTSGAFSPPSWELAMARKDARLMIESGEAHGTPLTMLPAIAATMDRFLARGHANDDWTVIGKDAVTR